jgi:cell division septum initiation protein DivIVA
MNKNEELAAWTSFADSIPWNSYTKGALSSLLVELENALRSDYLPTLCFADAHARAIRIKVDAHADAKKLLEQANKQAEAILSEAQKKVEQTSERFDRIRLKAISELEKL